MIIIIIVSNNARDEVVFSGTTRRIVGNRCDDVTPLSSNVYRPKRVRVTTGFVTDRRK